MIYTLNNISQLQGPNTPSIVQRSRMHRYVHTKVYPWYLRWVFKGSYYMLLSPLSFRLSNGDTITIPAGFIWDLSSIPKLFWDWLSPDGNFEVSSLLHDYMMTHRSQLGYDLKFIDSEMLKWSDEMNTGFWGRIDNRLRYYLVRAFSWTVKE